MHTMRLHAHYGTGGQGPVYQGRLKSFSVQDDEHFLLVCRYVERNALRAGLVRRTGDGTWGSLNRWLEEPEREPRLLSAWPIARSPRWAERVNKAADRTQGRSHQRQPGPSLGRRQWGAGHLAAPEPPVDPPPTRKTQNRVLTPFPTRTPENDPRPLCLTRTARASALRARYGKRLAPRFVLSSQDLRSSRSSYSSPPRRTKAAIGSSRIRRGCNAHDKQPFSVSEA